MEEALQAAEAWSSDGDETTLRDLLREGLRTSLVGTFTPKRRDGQIVEFCLEITGHGSCWVLPHVSASTAAWSFVASAHLHPDKDGMHAVLSTAPCHNIHLLMTCAAQPCLCQAYGLRFGHTCIFFSDADPQRIPTDGGQQQLGDAAAQLRHQTKLRPICVFNMLAGTLLTCCNRKQHRFSYMFECTFCNSLQQEPACMQSRFGTSVIAHCCAVHVLCLSHTTIRLLV